MIAILQASRENGCSDRQALEDCDQLHEAGEGYVSLLAFLGLALQIYNRVICLHSKMGTEEAVFTRIFCTRSHEQLRKINELYQDVSRS